MIPWWDMLHDRNAEQRMMRHTSLQTEGVFNRTLEAVKRAGAVLVPFNASSVDEYNNKHIGDPTLYTTELGGALSRYSHYQVQNKSTIRRSMP